MQAETFLSIQLKSKSTEKLTTGHKNFCEFPIV
jgi:hypothetical protein